MDRKLILTTLYALRQLRETNYLYIKAIKNQSRCDVALL